jgi:hypothetical protein
MILVVTDAIIEGEQKGDKFIVNTVESALRVCFEAVSILSSVISVKKETCLFVECFDYHPAKVSVTIQFDEEAQVEYALKLIESSKEYHAKPKENV